MKLLARRVWAWVARNHMRLQIAVSPVIVKSASHVPPAWWWYDGLITGLVFAGFIVAWQTPPPGQISAPNLQPVQSAGPSDPPESPAQES